MEKEKISCNISFDLPRELAKDFVQKARTMNKPIEDVFKETFGLGTWDNVEMNLSKHDKMIVPIIWNILNEITTVTNYYESNIKHCPDYKKQNYTALLSMVSSCKNIIESIIDTYEFAGGNQLSESEQTMATDFSTLISLIYQKILDNPKSLTTLMKTLKREFGIELTE